MVSSENNIDGASPRIQIFLEQNNELARVVGFDLIVYIFSIHCRSDLRMSILSMWPGSL